MAGNRSILIRYYITHILLLVSVLLSAQEPASELQNISQNIDTVDHQILPVDSMLIDSLAIDSIKEPFIEAPIEYNAKDSMIFSLDGQEVFLYNTAMVTYQEIELTADFIKLNLETKEVYAEGVLDTAGVVQGNPVFKDGSGEYESKTLRYNFKTQKGIITEVKTQQGEGYVHSQWTKKISKDAFILRDGKYTTCDADHPHFWLQLTKAKVISNKKIITGPAYMVLEDFPIYFPILPFGYFPNSTKYTSGILIPTYGEESNRGFFLREGGYYWAASDYFDVAVQGDIYSKGSWAAKMRTNYKLMYKFSGNFDFSYNVNVTGEKGLDTYKRSPQFRISWSHSQDQKSNPSRNFSASVNLSTSGFERQNSTTQTVDNYLQSQKSSSISFTKRWENTPFNMSANLRHSQNSRDSTISLSLPEMTFSMAKFYPFKRKFASGKVKWYEKLGFNYSGNFRNSISNVKENKLLHTSFAADWQNGIKHNIPISLPSFNLFKYMNFSPGFSYNEKWYFKSYNYSYSEALKKYETDTIPGFNRIYDYSYSLSATTNIYGNFVPLNTKSKIKGIRHKMTPSISFNYRPDFGKEKFGYYMPTQVDSTGKIEYKDRYYQGVYGGSPGRGASGAISLSITNNIEMKVLDTAKDTTKSGEKYKKVKLVDNLGLNASYDLIADSLNLSLINLRGRTTIKGVSINFGGIVDPYMVDTTGNFVTRVNRYAWDYNKGLAKLGRLTRANLSFGMQFSSQDLQKKSKKDEKEEGSEEEESQAAAPPPEYVEFNMPWNVNFDYNFNYTRSNPYIKGVFSQVVSFNGSLTITPKWSLTVNSNYDIVAKQFSFTTFNVHRDLHCWEMTFSFIPFGYMKSYSFTLNAKSGMLRDLKIDKRSSPYDNR